MPYLSPLRHQLRHGSQQVAPRSLQRRPLLFRQPNGLLQASNMLAASLLRFKNKSGRRFAAACGLGIAVCALLGAVPLLQATSCELRAAVLWDNAVSRGQPWRQVTWPH